jgi:hypothetical protein
VGKKFIKDLNFGNTNFAGENIFIWSYQYVVAFRLEGTFVAGKDAYDSILKDVKSTAFGRYERNLSFRSNIA